MTSTSKPRQIAAVYLHSILVELVTARSDLTTRLAGKKPRAVPCAVVWMKSEDTALPNGTAESVDELDAKTHLDAVNVTASQYGIKVGQTIAEARALVANLQIATLSHQVLQSAVERVAEALGRFGTTVAFEIT